MPTRARKLAEGNGVDIRYYNIIYDAVDGFKAAMSGMLAPRKAKRSSAHAEIRTVFVASKIGTVAGSYGHWTAVVQPQRAFPPAARQRGHLHGRIESVKHEGRRQEVKEGFECGIKLRNYNDIKEGDQLEIFEVKEIARTCEVRRAALSGSPSLNAQRSTRSDAQTAAANPTAATRWPTRSSAICRS